MVTLFLRLNSIRMNQRAERPSVDDKPGYKGTELRWSKDVYFKHSDRVWTNRTIEESIDAQLGD